MSNTTIYVEANWDHDAYEGNPNEYALSELDSLCFQCPLSECKENSVKCLQNIAKKAK